MDNPENLVSECCGQGTVWKGTPKGTVGEIAGIPTYVAKSETPAKQAILVIHDVFGWRFPNTRLIADELAKNGYDAYLPDFFQGSEIDPGALDVMMVKGGSMWDKFKGGMKLMVNVPTMVNMFAIKNKSAPALIDKVVEKLSQDYEKVGLVGFCFGGMHGKMLSKREMGKKITTYILCHPGGPILVPEDTTNFPSNVMYVLAEIEPWEKNYPVKDIQESLKSQDKPEKRSTSKLYPGTTHGFAVRVDEADADLVKQRDEALKDIIGFFKETM